MKLILPFKFVFDPKKIKKAQRISEADESLIGAEIQSATEGIEKYKIKSFVEIDGELCINAISNKDSLHTFKASHCRLVKEIKKGKSNGRTKKTVSKTSTKPKTSTRKTKTKNKTKTKTRKRTAS